MEEKEFSEALQIAINDKLNWFNTVCLEDMLAQYRLIHTCIKNLYELLVRRSLIVEDPYRLDRRIHDIVLPESSSFADTELPAIFGARFSDYETMLDFICTYFRFSVENITLPTIKKLISFNNFFDWNNLSGNSSKVNTRALAIIVDAAKSSSDSVTQSTINDGINKCKSTFPRINKSLEELAVFQRELYKFELRKDIFEHPDFNKAKAGESEAAELAEIKRIHGKVTGNKHVHLYGDLINEIIKENHGSDRDIRQQRVLQTLRIKVVPKKVKKNVEQLPDCRLIIMTAVQAIGGMAPIISKLRIKLLENFNLLFARKNTFFSKFLALLRKALGIKEKRRVVSLTIKDTRTGTERIQKVVVSEFIGDLMRKEHSYGGIASRGPEYAKIDGASEDAVLIFVGKQISEMQSIYNLINAFDAYFKSEVDPLLKPRVRGLKIELSALRSAIINVNKKRGEYVSQKEEAEQMKKLGIVDE